ncbi:putative DNA repair protein NTG1 [Zalerion maritima]|uniref:Endonuclease III homolog n=1 Tax=Zalerion maritima TaxID=339359 RepID=A0AAD5RQ96_9PEZI|nr:putative DNA repair protein NTG1 [Zalerion maritima]
MPPSPPTPPRRITRGSLARYAYQASEQARLNSPSQNLLDIEDSTPSSARKRKRTSTNITATSSAGWSRKTRLKEESESKSPVLKASETTPRTTTTRVKSEVKSEYFESGAASTRSSRPRQAKVKAEAAKTGLNSESDDEIKPSATPKRARKPARKVQAGNGQVKVEPPSDWLEMYELVKTMRLDDGPAANAPVDTMGCERLAQRTVSPKDKRFQTLIALMLSSQTKDTVNAVAMKRLQTELEAHAPGALVGLNLENILAVEPARLNELIGLVGFHNNKTKYIKQAAVILRDKFGGDIPDTIQGLVSLPGVGPKMAHLCMSAAWDKTEGIGVDVHVHRITNLWGWNRTKNPEETRMALESWLPRDKWREINWLLVGFGQLVCVPIGRKCGQCELGHNGLCKAVDRKKVNDGKLLRRQQMDAELDGDENDGSVKKRAFVPLPLEDYDLTVKEEIDSKDAKKPGTAQVPAPKEEDNLPGVKEEPVKEERDGHDSDAVMESIELLNIKLDLVKKEEGPSEARTIKREDTPEQVVLRQRTAKPGQPEGRRALKQESRGHTDVKEFPKTESAGRSASIKRESTGC